VPGLTDPSAALDIAADGIHPFRIEGVPVRGRLVRLSDTLDRVLSHRDYPAPVADLLAEAMVLAVMLANAIKFDGVFTLKTRGDGPVRLIVVDVTSEGTLRATAQVDSERLDAVLGDGRLARAPVPRLIGAGQLLFTVDQGPETERYQGIVELDGATLSDCAHNYFHRSEQIETGIMLVADAAGPEHRHAGGLMVQRMPADDDASGEDFDDDAWRRSFVLMSSATRDELLDPSLAPRDLLFRLFHEDGVWVYDSLALGFSCRCSRERIEAMLQALPRDEVETMKQDGRVEVACEFCGRTEIFDDAAIEALHAA
jgi:molecular chaperone Hsp33